MPYFAHLLVEIPLGFELLRNWSINCDNSSQQHVEAIHGSFDFIGPACTSSKTSNRKWRNCNRNRIK